MSFLSLRLLHANLFIQEETDNIVLQINRFLPTSPASTKIHISQARHVGQMWKKETIPGGPAENPPCCRHVRYLLDQIPRPVLVSS